MARLRRRGVYLLPSLLTTANILCGFISGVMAFHGDFTRSAALIFLAGVLDGLDGRIARLTGATSEFGGEYDSLADIVSFGLAPSFLALIWGLAPLHRAGWVLAFFFLVCGAVRLARFNIQHGATDRRWFVGLPIPMAAAVVAGIALHFEGPIQDPLVAAAFGAGILALSLLMVSRIRYRSFKDVKPRTRRPFRTIVVIAAVLAAIVWNAPLVLMVLAGLYAASGPLAHLLHLAGLDRYTSSASRGMEEQAPSPAEAPTGAR